MSDCFVNHRPGSSAQMLCPVHGARRGAFASPGARIMLARPWEQKLVGSSSDATGRELRILARSNAEEARAVVAANPVTPVETLEMLAGDDSDSVLCALTGNPSTPPAVLEALARHRSVQVVAAVALSPHSPKQVLRRLARSGVRDVACAAASNPALPGDELLRLASGPSKFERAAAAANPKMPLSQLLALAADADRRVRAAAIANPSLPDEELSNLADADPAWAPERRAQTLKRIGERFGITDPDGQEALAVDRWWEAGLEDQAVQLVRALYPPEDDA